MYVGGKDHTRGAYAALARPLFQKSIPDGFGIQDFSRGFNGKQMFSVKTGQGHQAGIYRDPAFFTRGRIFMSDNYRAGTAIAPAAHFLGPGHFFVSSQVMQYGTGKRRTVLL